MANILAIDSSTEACSVALTYNNQTFSLFEHQPRKHAELILPMVDKVLNQASINLNNLDAIACCVGPGAFTGLRIAISIAQGLAYAANLPCISVSSLQTLAVEAFNKTDASFCLSAIDARMNEVYFSAYTKKGNGEVEEIHHAQVIGSQEIVLSEDFFHQLSQNQRCAKVGNGWENYSFSSQVNSIDAEEVDVIYPKAKMMLPLAKESFNQQKLLKPEFLQPVYLRNNVAKKKSEQK